MDLSHLRLKITRLYAVMDSATEADLSKFPATWEHTEAGITVRQDFNRGMGEAELHNAAFQIIRTIADLKDHLRAAARRLGFDPEDVESIIDNSLPLQLMLDLANWDKHGQLEKPARQRSKRSPRLVNLRGALQ
jgi:hypothetical protein